MDSQMFFNWAVGLVGFLGGWLLKVIWDAIGDLKKDMRLIERGLPEVYVRRDDFKEAVKEIKDDVREGFNKVDSNLGLIFKKLESR